MDSPSALSGRRPLLLGHRGARRYAPENSLAAFQLALDHGCDGFEFDVRLTADRRSIICHDPRLGGRAVSRNSYERLCASVKSPAPCLPDVLSAFADRAFLDIELKVAGLEGDLAALLRAHPPQRGYFVSSFLPEVIEELHRANSSLPLGLICDTQRKLARWRTLPVSAVFLELALATPRVFDELRVGDKEVFVWTVNRPRDMLRLAQLDAAGIISDDTKLLAQTLAANSRYK